MSEQSLLTVDHKELVDRATLAMARASEEARKLAEATGTEFIAASSEKTVYAKESLEALRVREEPDA